MAKILKVLALAGAAAHLAAFFFVAAARLVYPFELEYIEGGLVDEVRAVLAGAPLYAAPNIHQVAFIYPPLYLYASAALSAVVGRGFLPLRLVSFAASAACLALAGGLARRSGAGWSGGLLAAGLLAAAFKVGAGWMSLARVDALFVALFLAGAWALRHERYSAAGLLLALACLTKQSALTMALPLAAYAAYAERRRGWRTGASLAAVLIGASALLDWATQGWYGYYVFRAALAQHMVSPTSMTMAWTDWRGQAGLALLAALAGLALVWRRPRPVGFWLVLAAGTGATVYWVQLHQGAVENNLLPLLAVLAGLGSLAALNRPAGQPARSQSLAYGLCVVLFALLAYNPQHYLPTAANRAAGQALAQRLAQVSGEVWLPEHGGLAWLAGKPSYAHLAAMEDVLSEGGPAAAELMDAVRAALRERRFAGIIVDGPDFARLFPELEQYYAAAGEVAPGAAFYNVSGARTLPETMYVPRPP